ncbi:MAG: sarcosine oxidase subunit gamma family protein [Micropepsaceae bacterium]
MRDHPNTISVEWERPPPLVELRLADVSTDALKETSAALGIVLTQEANRWSRGSPGNALLAPGIWLIQSDLEALEATARLRKILHHSHDISTGLSQCTLEGADTNSLLSLSCGLDFRDTAFPPACITRTLFAGVPVIISRPDARNTVHLYADRSLTHYLTTWLADAQTGLQSLAHKD